MAAACSPTNIHTHRCAGAVAGSWWHALHPFTVLTVLCTHRQADGRAHLARVFVGVLVGVQVVHQPPVRCLDVCLAGGCSHRQDAVQVVCICVRIAGQVSVSQLLLSECLPVPRLHQPT